MAKKKHAKGHLVISTAEVVARIRRAVNEGRSQSALELARQLYKDENTPAHLELLKEASLARARQLRQAGYTRDAITVLDNCVSLAPQDAGWLTQLAEEFALSGAPERTSALLSRTNDPAAQGPIQARAVDAALERGVAGRSLLPEELRGGFDLIVQALEQSAAGQDEAAREALHGIGLRSPFLEWKLLLRGLLAYYQRDEARALDNWQRLDAGRLPARLAAPLRFSIDPTYRAAQPPATQQAVQQQADRLQGSGFLPLLRSIRAALAKEGGLAHAFRQAEQMLSGLRQEAPALVPRLASCFYWAIVNVGWTDDVPRFRRVFAVPVDDNESLDRLQALLYERAGEMGNAHKHWQRFESWVANYPDVWPAGQSPRVRALVWEHMGRNAASVPDPDKMPDLPPFLRDHPGRPRPLKPSAEECFQHSLELAPDRLTPYEALFDSYERDGKDKQAERIGRQMVERFPNHLQGLVEFAQHLMRTARYAEAVALFERALKINPLDRDLRAQLSTAHTFQARAFAEGGDFDRARTEYQEAIASSPQPDHSSVLCKWAACEFKAGNPTRAEELITQALTETGHRLPVAYSMLIEMIRLRLPRPLKTRFDREFNAALAEPPSPAAAANTAVIMSAHRLAGVTYIGQKTHEKKILAYLERAHDLDFTESQFENICASLLAIDSVRQLRAFTASARAKSPANPRFPLMEAESYIHKGPEQSPPWKLLPLLTEADRLAAALPPDAKREELLNRIQRYREMVNLLGGGGIGGFLEQMMDVFGGGGWDDAEPRDEEDDDWDDGWDDDWDDDEFVFEPEDFLPPPKKKKKKKRRR